MRRLLKEFEIKAEDFRIYEQIYQRVSMSNMEDAGDIALKLFDEVTILSS